MPQESLLSKYLLDELIPRLSFLYKCERKKLEDKPRPLSSQSYGNPIPSV